MLWPAFIHPAVDPRRALVLLGLVFKAVFDVCDSRLTIVGTWIGSHLFIVLEEHAKEWDFL